MLSLLKVNCQLKPHKCSVCIQMLKSVTWQQQERSSLSRFFKFKVVHLLEESERKTLFHKLSKTSWTSSILSSTCTKLEIKERRERMQIPILSGLFAYKRLSAWICLSLQSSSPSLSCKWVFLVSSILQMQWMSSKSPSQWALYLQVGQQSLTPRWNLFNCGSQTC